MIRILVVEDNRTLAQGLQRSLETEGYEVQVVTRGDEARAAIHGFDPQLVVLDLMLPGRDGLDVLRGARKSGLDVPVLILSARGEDVDKIQGFRLGADDYVVKPVSLMELLYRVEAILRRVGVGTEERRARYHVIGDVEVDLDGRTITRNGGVVEVSPREFDLLTCLIKHRGEAVTRAQLLSEVWGFPDPSHVHTRTIDTHVAALRGKIEQQAEMPRYIVTVRKVGYRLELATASG